MPTRCSVLLFSQVLLFQLSLLLNEDEVGLMSFYSTIPTDAGRYQSLPLSSVTLGDVVLNGVDGSAAVFVPQVDGFGDDGVRVFLRDLRGEKP